MIRDLNWQISAAWFATAGGMLAAGVCWWLTSTYYGVAFGLGMAASAWITVADYKRGMT